MSTARWEAAMRLADNMRESYGVSGSMRDTVSIGRSRMEYDYARQQTIVHLACNTEYEANLMRQLGQAVQESREFDSINLETLNEIITEMLDRGIDFR